MPLRCLSSLLTRGRAPTANLTRHTLLVPACVAPRFPWCYPLLLHPARAATTTTIPSVSHPPQDAVVPQEPRRSHKIDFGNTKVAYASVSTGELVRAYLVFKACSFRPLVTHADKLLQISYRLLGQAITESIVRNTFFAHFCAGETSQTIRPRIEELRKGGVAGILDYAAEADITQMMTSPLTKPKTHAYKEGEIACRVYSYESERQCDAHVETFLDCIHAVKDVTPEGFAAIKITALGNPHLLERMSVCIEETDRLFKKMDREGKGWITRKEFLDGYDRFFRSTPAPPSETSPAPAGIWAVKPEEMATQLLNRLDPENTDRIDVIDWRMAVNISDMPALTHQCRETGPLKNAALSEQEMELMRAMQLRLEMLAGRAATLGVRLMIDAEQSYFQPAIDFLILDVMQRHNRDAFVVYTTMQCYLRDATERLEMEIERARRGGFLFAAKLVRGAYMVSERKRAVEKVRLEGGREDGLGIRGVVSYGYRILVLRGSRGNLCRTF